jgi:hypothetical protein
VLPLRILAERFGGLLLAEGGGGEGDRDQSGANRGDAHEWLHKKWLKTRGL